MKKLWEIVVSDRVELEIAKKIKRLLRPSRSVGRPQKCLFCEVETSWTLNDKPVCPKCAVKYKFLGEQWLLDPCEVCGRQGEWATEGDPQHFLCYQHRDNWFCWEKSGLRHIDHKKQPEEWERAWDKEWADFVAFSKERLSV